jgi:hypothetical protein
MRAQGAELRRVAPEDACPPSPVGEFGPQIARDWVLAPRYPLGSLMRSSMGGSAKLVFWPVLAASLATGCHHPLPPGTSPLPDAGIDGPTSTESADVGQDLGPPPAGRDPRCPGPPLTTWDQARPPACLEPCSLRWDWELIIDAADCSSRAVTDCGPGALNDPRAPVPLGSIAHDCHVGSYLFLRADFSSGCATRLLVARAQGPSPDDRSLADCVAAALSTKRWSCGSELTCSVWEIDSLR